MTDPENLPPELRAARYRHLSQQAAGYAARSKNEEVKKAYALMAREWLLLAEHIEANRRSAKS